MSDTGAWAWSFFRVNSYSRRPASRGLTSLVSVLCFLGAQLRRAARSIQLRLIRPVPTLCYCSQVASRERRTWTTEKLKEPTLLSRFFHQNAVLVLKGTISRQRCEVPSKRTSESSFGSVLWFFTRLRAEGKRKSGRTGTEFQGESWLFAAE